MFYPQNTIENTLWIVDFCGSCYVVLSYSDVAMGVACKLVSLIAVSLVLLN